MARGFCFSPVACLISFASSKETGKARSPSSGARRHFGGELLQLDAESLARRGADSLFKFLL